MHATNPRFNPESINCFSFGPRSFDPTTGVACFEYALDDHAFSEQLIFAPQANLSDEQILAVNNALDIAHALLGVSYYKAACPKTIDSCALRVTAKEAAFIETVWLHGLGEFAHLNQLDLHGRIDIAPTLKTRRTANLTPTNRVLVPIGGGKDSMVSLEALRPRFDVSAFVLGNYAVIERMIEVADVPAVRVQRRLDPHLFELNDRGAYNGHIPISSIYAISAVIAACLAGFDAIALSNERSADEANIVNEAHSVNHQYSKSSAFEAAFQTLVHSSIAPSLDYFSLLRPLSEFAIAKRFAALTQYHDDFSSCNRSFTLTKKPNNARWCGQCPKCRFVYLILAPWLSRERLTTIFGADLLNDSQQIDGYRALLGIGDHKPFECVGEIAECALAFHLLTTNPQWMDAPIVRTIGAELPTDIDFTALESAYLASANAHFIPPRFIDALG